MRKSHLAEMVSRALHEDIGRGDITSEAVIPRDGKARAVLVARAAGVLCGIEVAAEAFRQRKCSVRVRKRDGSRVRRGDVCLEARGPARAVLAAERTALNFVQRLSGVATLTRRFVEAVKGTRAKICDTRKTTPGLRALERHAVKCGGGTNHRAGLHDAALIKENHLALAGDLETAVRRLRSRAAFVAIEAQSRRDLARALALPVDLILLDNFSAAELKRAVGVIRRRRTALIEASGGVTLANVRSIARTGVDRISVGALTHSAPALDFSVDVFRA